MLTQAHYGLKGDFNATAAGNIVENYRQIISATSWKRAIEPFLVGLVVVWCNRTWHRRRTPAPPSQSQRFASKWRCAGDDLIRRQYFITASMTSRCAFETKVGDSPLCRLGQYRQRRRRSGADKRFQLAVIHRTDALKGNNCGISASKHDVTH